MPLYTYHCRKCDNTFETLVMGSESARCPACNSLRLDWLPGMTAPPPRSKSIIKASRAQAQREGHMSNYSASTQTRLRQGKTE